MSTRPEHFRQRWQQPTLQHQPDQAAPDHNTVNIAFCIRLTTLPVKSQHAPQIPQPHPTDHFSRVAGAVSYRANHHSPVRRCTDCTICGTPGHHSSRTRARGNGSGSRLERIPKKAGISGHSIAIGKALSAAFCTRNRLGTAPIEDPCRLVERRDCVSV